MKHIFLFLFSLFFISPVFAKPIVYVTLYGAGNNSGSSWTNALPGVELSNRVVSASAGTQFWVAAGTYKPTTTTDRTASFSIASGVSVYGGFAGTETALGQRIVGSNETILSGDIGIEGVVQDNCIHVVLLLNVNQTIILNGLTIRDGHRLGYDYDGSGAGIYANLTNNNLTLIVSDCRIIHNIVEGSLTGGGGIGIFNKANSLCNVYLKNSYLSNNEADNGGAFAAFVNSGSVNTTIDDCIFSNNKGFTISGAIYYESASSLSSLTLKRCQFINNNASYWGGAISAGKSHYEVDACLFMNNSVTPGSYFGGNYGGGGAIEGSGSKSIFTNCLFVNNTAPRGGVVYSNSQAGPTQHKFINCTFINNTASVSGGVFNNILFDQAFNPTTTNLNETYLKNCLIWQNTSPDSPVFKSQLWLSPESDRIYNSLIATYSLMQGNYPGTGNINSDPLFVDASNGDFHLKANSPAINVGDPNTTDLPANDLAGQLRIQGGRVDMGAYEFFSCLVAPCIPILIRKSK